MNTPCPSSSQLKEIVKPKLYNILFATCVGNALEWFDIAVYAFFASYIAHEFFPAINTSVSLIMTFGTFGISFLIRPLGAIVLGSYADRHGRKKALLLSINLMMLGCAIIAFMPGYKSIGLIAPIMILIARLIQGFSAGGEFGSSTAFLVEHFPERRAFIASWQFATQGISTLLASGVGLGVTYLMTESQIQQWGWRIPFILGLLIGPVGIYIRQNINESASFLIPKPHLSPLKMLVTKQKELMLLASGLMVISTAINYMLNYVPTYGVQNLHLSESASFFATFLGGGILAVVTPLMGLWAERVGRMPLMWSALLLLIITIYPAFILVVKEPTVLKLIILVCWMALLKSAYFSTVPSVMADLFPVNSRASGMSISYNLAVTIFGGFSPLISTLLISITGNDASPGYYLIMVAFLSSGALLRTRYVFNTRRKNAQKSS